MNKLFLTFFLTLLNIFPLIGDRICADVCRKTTFEIRGGAFFPTSHEFREIYGHVEPCYSIEGATGFCNCFDAWLNLDFFTKKRKIEGCGRTRADVYSLSLGVKYILPTCTCFDLYVGLGPNISWLHINDRLMCGEECTRKCSFGGVVKTGINYYFCDNLFIDIFVDYLYQPTKIHHKHIDIGGLKTGIGLGVAF